MRARCLACVAVASALFAAGPAGAQDDDGPTLHELAAAGRLERLAVALRQGADVDARDQQGRTPLHVAAAEGQVFVVMLLVRQGANLDARDAKGRTALHAAVTGSSETEAARFRIVQLLVAEGADTRRRDRDGKRARDYATSPEFASALVP